MTPRATAADTAWKDRREASALVARALKSDSSPGALGTLARRLGVSTETVTRWATGVNYPPTPKVALILRELGSAS